MKFTEACAYGMALLRNTSPERLIAKEDLIWWFLTKPLAVTTSEN